MRAKSKRTVFLHQGTIVNREQVKQIIRNGISQSNPLSRIAQSIGLYLESMIFTELIHEVQQDIRNEHPKARYAIVSEHPFPKTLADDEIMDRLQGPWLHAMHLEDTDEASVRKRLESMGDDFGWIRIVKIIPVDQVTLLDKDGEIN